MSLLLLILSAQLGSSKPLMPRCWIGAFLCSDDLKHAYCCTKENECKYGRTDLSSTFELDEKADPCASKFRFKDRPNTCKTKFVNSYCPKNWHWFLSYSQVTAARISDLDRKILTKEETDWQRVYMNLIGMASLPSTDPEWVSSAARMVSREAQQRHMSELIMFSSDMIQLEKDAAEVDKSAYQTLAGTMYDKYWQDGGEYQINLSGDLFKELKTKSEAINFANYKVWRKAYGVVFKLMLTNWLSKLASAPIHDTYTYKVWKEGHPLFEKEYVKYMKTEPAAITPNQKVKVKLARSEYKNINDWDDFDDEGDRMEYSSGYAYGNGNGNMNANAMVYALLAVVTVVMMCICCFFSGVIVVCGIGYAVRNVLGSVTKTKTDEVSQSEEVNQI